MNMATIRTFTVKNSIDVEDGTVELLKKITGKTNDNEAVEHFCKSCLELGIDPGLLISNMNLGLGLARMKGLTRGNS